MRQSNRGNQRHNQNHPHVSPTTNHGAQSPNANSDHAPEVARDKHITGNISILEGKKWSRTEMTAVVAVVVSVVLAFFTFMLFLKTGIQTEAALRADSIANNNYHLSDSIYKATNNDSKATAAQTKKYNDSFIQSQKDALAETKRYNDGSLAMQQKVFDSNNKDIKERYKRDTTAIGLQIKSLKQNQEQFIKQNEPFLKVIIDSMTMRYNQVVIHYTIFDLSNTPIKITGERTQVDWGQFNQIIKFDFLEDITDGDIYVTKDAPQPKEMTIKKTTQDQRNWIMNGTYSVFWDCSYEYVNLVTDEKRIYSFKVKITRRTDGRYLYQSFSENINRKK